MRHLIVAGGGSAGYYGGGGGAGGGAGGSPTPTKTAIGSAITYTNSTTYPITVGGASSVGPGSVNPKRGISGSNSVITHPGGPYLRPVVVAVVVMMVLLLLMLIVDRPIRWIWWWRK